MWGKVRKWKKVLDVSEEEICKCSWSSCAERSKEFYNCVLFRKRPGDVYWGLIQTVVVPIALDVCLLWFVVYQLSRRKMSIKITVTCLCLASPCVACGHRDSELLTLSVSVWVPPYPTLSALPIVLSILPGKFPMKIGFVSELMLVHVSNRSFSYFSLKGGINFPLLMSTNMSYR